MNLAFYIGQFQLFQLGEYNLQPQLITPLSKGFGHCRTLFGHIIDESKRIGGTSRNCLFQHVRCEGNRLAHCLAKKAVLSADTDVWIESLHKDVFALNLCCFFLVLVFFLIIFRLSLSKKKKKISPFSKLVKRDEENGVVYA